MQQTEVLEIFKKANAILEGHFILTSGLHSAIYMQKAKVFMHSNLTEQLCKALAQKIIVNIKEPIKYLVGPAIGGVIPAYETSRHLNIPSIWVERVQGEFCLKRFDIKKGDNVVIIEDIVTTGLSIKETVTALQKAEANILAAACILDRSAGKSDICVPLISLCEYEVPAYEADDIPPELAKIPAIKPGSRTN